MHAVGAGEGRVERGERSAPGPASPPAAADAVDEAGRPDQVVGEDDDPRARRRVAAHPSAAARCRNTSAAADDARPAAAVLDDRDVAEPADRHLVDRDGERVVGAEHDRVGRHEVADVERVEPLAGDLHDRVAVGEDADQPAAVAHEQAVEPSACIRWIASATAVVGSTELRRPERRARRGACRGACRGTRARAAGCRGRARSAPQLAQVSSPSKFS